MNKPTPTKDQVKAAAEKLAAANGTITTLEVKTELRLQNFFATQAFVSQVMDELCSENSWNYHYNGTYREYTDITPVANITAPVLNPTAINEVELIDHDKTVHVVEVLDNPVTDGWVGYSTGYPNAYFDTTCTRDIARRAYSKMYKVDFIDVRAIRVK